MKSIIVYYSATGNTKKIAQAIHAGMKDSIEECDIVPIKKVNNQDLVKYDLIGLGSPLWGGRETDNVRIFLKDIPDLKGKLGFPFCTHGAWPIGFMYWVVAALQQKGLTIIGYNDWYGDVKQLPYMPKPYPTDGHPDEIDLKEAEDFGREMAKRARRISAGETEHIPELPEGPDVDMLWKRREVTDNPSPYAQCVKIAREQRRLNMEKCAYPECSLCVDICPMDSIDFSVNPPAFKQNCRMCFSCEAICPQGAIEIDYESIFGTTELGVSGAEHPFVNYLKEAAAKGRFRWLVPLDKVGFDTPIWKIPGHPRYVIE